MIQIVGVMLIVVGLLELKVRETFMMGVKLHVDGPAFIPITNENSRFLKPS